MQYALLWPGVFSSSHFRKRAQRVRGFKGKVNKWILCHLLILVSFLTSVGHETCSEKLTFIKWTKKMWVFFFFLTCSTKESWSCRFGTTWGWEMTGFLFLGQLTILMKLNWNICEFLSICSFALFFNDGMKWFLQIQNVRMIVSDLNQLKRADYDFVHGSSGLHGFFPRQFKNLKT